MTSPPTADSRASRLQEWKTYWPLVLASAVGFAFYSVLINAIGLFVQPLSAEFGWSRTEIMLGVTLMSIAAIVLSPFVGALIDRFGSRRIALPGLVLTSFCLASFGLANGSVLQWTTMWVVAAFVMLMIKTTVWTAAVAGTFTAGRSMAIALTMSGTAVAQAIVPPLARWLIEDYGWRNAYFALGLGWGSVAFLLSAFFLYDAKDRKRLADQVLPKKDIVPTNLDDIPGLTLKEALRSPPLVRIGIATFIVMLMGVGIGVNLVPILVESGISRETAAYFASMFGVAGIVGKLVTGWLMDRFNPNIVGGLTLGVSAFAFLLLLKQFNHPALIMTGIVAIGYASGTKLQICVYLTSLYAGMRNYGKIFGVMSSMIAVGGGFGPTAAAAVYDTTGSYSLFIYAALVLTLFASSLIFRLGPKPKEFTFA